MIVPEFPSNLIQFNKQFGTEEACLLYIRRQRWGSDTGFECPKCKHNKGWTGRTRDILYCGSCKHQVSITAGTQFHKTRKSLVLWFMAMYLMSSSKQGMSAKELQRQLGLGSYQTAWAWLHKLRRAMVDPDRTPLQSPVEVDETYVGGIAVQSAGGRSVIKKTAVACAVEKQDPKGCGRVRLAIIMNATKAKLKDFLDGKIEAESTIHTDGWRGYDGLENSGFKHIRIVAKKTEKAHITFPLVHRVFSLLKRWLLATHQGAVSRKHLQAYLEEFTFRFNRRKATKISHTFQRLMEGAVREQAKPYWQIVGRTANNVTIRHEITLEDILAAAKARVRV